MKKRYIATLQNFSHVPPDTIYRGAGMVDFEAEVMPESVKERLEEYAEDGTRTFRKPGFNVVIPKRPPKPEAAGGQ